MLIWTWPCEPKVTLDIVYYEGSTASQDLCEVLDVDIYYNLHYDKCYARCEFMKPIHPYWLDHVFRSSLGGHHWLEWIQKPWIVTWLNCIPTHWNLIESNLARETPYEITASYPLLHANVENIRVAHLYLQWPYKVFTLTCASLNNMLGWVYHFPFDHSMHCKNLH